MKHLFLVLTDMIKKILVIAALMLVSGVYNSFAAAEFSEDEQAVLDTLTAMWAAVEAGDIETYASYIHPDFTAFGENDTYLLTGKDKELRSIGDWIERSHDIHTEMHQPEVTIIGDVAWVTYYWSDAGYTDDQRFTSRGKSTRIFTRSENGRWLARHGHYTAVP